MGRRPKSTFLKQEIQMTKRHIKKGSTSVITTEMQIKTTIAPHANQNGYHQKIHKQ